MVCPAYLAAVGLEISKLEGWIKYSDKNYELIVRSDANTLSGNTVLNFRGKEVLDFILIYDIVIVATDKYENTAMQVMQQALTINAVKTKLIWLIAAQPC